MKGNDLLNIMGNADYKFIAEAEIIKANKKRGFVKWVTIAACLCIAVIAIFLSNIFVPNNENTSLSQNGIKATENTSSKSFDNSPIKYSDLILADGKDNDISISSDSELCVAAFEEKFLKEDGCCMIVEGTVKNIYSKKYKYDVSDDKFEDNGVLHNIMETVVYEISVDKTWFGNDVTGQTIIVEDNSYCLDPLFKIKAGKKYVVPLFEYGNSILYSKEEKENFLSGDIVRESKFSTVYPYHPQIEVTKDSKYIVSENWKTLISEKAREIVVDLKDKDNYVYFQMYLLDGDTFKNAMNRLIDKRLN